MIVGIEPAKGLWSVDWPLAVGSVTVKDDCKGTIMELKPLEGNNSSMQFSDHQATYTLLVSRARPLQILSML